MWSKRKCGLGSNLISDWNAVNAVKSLIDKQNSLSVNEAIWGKEGRSLHLVLVNRVGV